MAGFVVLDPFVAANGTALASHTPNLIGTGWTEQVKTGAQTWEIHADEARIGTAELDDRVLHTVDDAPATAEYQIVTRLDALDISGDETFFLIARFTDTSNFYLCSIFSHDDGADRRLHKNVGGTITEIASGDAGGGSTDERVVFEVTNARK